MSNTNKKYLDENLKKEIWFDFLEKFSRIKSQNQLKEALDNILTPTEQIILEKRLAVMHLIKSGLSYREIGRAIDISPSAISFIKSGFKKKSTKEHEKRGATHLVGSRDKNKSILSKYPKYRGRGRWRFLNNT